MRSSEIFSIPASPARLTARETSSLPLSLPRARRSPSFADCIPMDILLTPASLSRAKSKPFLAASNGLHSTVISAPFSANSRAAPTILAILSAPSADGVPPPRYIVSALTPYRECAEEARPYKHPPKLHQGAGNKSRSRGTCCGRRECVYISPRYLNSYRCLPPKIDLIIMYLIITAVFRQSAWGIIDEFFVQRFNFLYGNCCFIIVKLDFLVGR